MWREDALAAGRFLAQLPGFLRQRLTPAQAEATLAARLAARDGDFLRLLARALAAQPDHPYAALLRHAGCAYGDVEALVRRCGLEAALRTLAGEGVYLTVDELKGRRPAVRGGVEIRVDPQRLRNPAAVAHVAAQTSGSGGARAAVPIDLAYVRDCAVDSLLMLQARGGLDWSKGHWAPLGGGAMMSVLQLSAFGAPSARWFSHVDPRDRTLHPRFRWAAWAMAATSRLAGVPLPWPRHVPPDDGGPVAAWMHATLAGGGIPHLLTYPSSAAHIAEAARARGLDLSRAQVTISGEPVTAARLTAGGAAGATVVPRYGTAETGPIGLGCLAAAHPDEMHVLTDLHAVVQLDRPPAGLPPSALFLTSLRPTTPFVLINVSFGDEGQLRARACGCPLEARGWHLHLSGIRSFEKLTAAGVTLLDADLLPVLDEVLPARFGGTGSDYQLVEHEAPNGRPRLTLHVHPRLGPLDAGAVRDAVLAAVAAQSPTAQVMAAVWRRSDVLHVLRAPPRRAASGKVVHLLRAAATPAAAGGAHSSGTSASG